MKHSPWKLIVVCGSLMSIFLFASAFTLLWVRSDIAKEADHIASLEYQLLKLQDRLAELEVKVDDSVQPHVLKSRTEGVLQTPAEGQVVRVVAKKGNALDAHQWAYLIRANNSGKGGV